MLCLELGKMPRFRGPLNHLYLDVTFNDVSQMTEDPELGLYLRIGAVRKFFLESSNGHRDSRNRDVTTDEKPRPIVPELHGTRWGGTRTARKWDLKRAFLVRLF